MSIRLYLKHWCQAKGLSLCELSEQTGVATSDLQEFQQGEWDPPLSIVTAIARSLDVPMSWLHYDPLVIQRLWSDPEEDRPTLPDFSSPDPLLQRIIQLNQDYQDHFALLASLLHHGDAKLIRAAQVSLQSLAKQVRPIGLPWGSRPPGHFEPPSD